MSDKRRFILAHAEARQRAIECVRAAPEGYQVVVSPPPRNNDQNAALWAKLSDISKQVQWHGIWLSTDDWKHIFTAALKKTRVVPNLDGSGFVILGQQTSRMSKREFSDLLELITAFGAEKGVRWGDD